jgi:hypothetical protein
LLQALEEGSVPPACTVTLTTPTLEQACTSEPCSVSDIGSYPFQFHKESKHQLMKAGELLETLINTPVGIQIAAGPDIVGTAQLDLLPAATAGSSTIAVRLDLKPVHSGEGPSRLLPDANVTISVRFLRDPSDGTTAQPAADAEQNAADGADHRVPHHCVDPNNVESTTVLTIAPGALSSAPAILSSAPGGFRGSLGLLWSSQDSTAGVKLPTADWQDGGFAWPKERRVVVERSAFAALQEAVLGGKDAFLELARCVGCGSEVMSLARCLVATCCNVTLTHGGAASALHG